MRKDVNELMVDAQDLLEKGLQKCLGLTKGLIRNLERKVEREGGYRLLSNTELREELTNVSGDLYEVIAKTLFNLIPVLQPEDCEDGQAINFYFWPGYHSDLINKRIFVEQEDKNPFEPHKPNRWNFGVGICGRPGGESSLYHDSCQARLFHFLIKPRNESQIIPVDIHRLLLRRAADHKDDLSRFLVVTNKPKPIGATKDSYFELTSEHGTEHWGSQLDDFVRENLMEKLLGGPRRNRNEEVMPFRQYAQNKLQSLWLHSAFCDFEPPWLPSFMEELGLHSESLLLKSSLNRALADETATKWGDWNKGRPLFSSWVNLSLSPWLDPTNFSFGEDGQFAAKKSRTASKTVGSAAFLSSLPVRPLYLAFAKHWVNEVYNALRNAEMAMLIFNKRLQVLEAIHAGPFFSHEIQLLVDQTLPTVQRQIAKDNENAIQTRRFLLYSIRTLCTLAYSFTRVVLSQKEYDREREDYLLVPLNDLRASETLLPNLTSIAKETYESLKVGGGGIVIFEPSKAPEIPADQLQHGACFLLILELLRNYCHSDSSGPTATFRARLDGDILVIELEGSTQAGRKPMSMSVARLNRFLRVLGVGQVTMDWDSKLKWFKSSIQVNLKPGSATRNRFS